MGCRAEIRTRACLTASQRATNWATLQPTEPQPLGRSASPWCGSWSWFLFGADSDQTFHSDADPDPDSSFQIKAKPLKKCSNRLVFPTFWLFICKLMLIWIRIQLITLMRIRILIFIFDVDPDPDFYLMRFPKLCGSGFGSATLVLVLVTSKMRFLS